MNSSTAALKAFGIDHILCSVGVTDNINRTNKKFSRFINYRSQNTINDEMDQKDLPFTSSPPD